VESFHRPRGTQDRIDKAMVHVKRNRVVAPGTAVSVIRRKTLRMALAVSDGLINLHPVRAPHHHLTRLCGKWLEVYRAFTYAVRSVVWRRR